jgi:hypothetical protein
MLSKLKPLLVSDSRFTPEENHDNINAFLDEQRKLWIY